MNQRLATACDALPVRLALASLSLLAGLAGVGSYAAAQDVNKTTAAAATYVRVDSDHTTVVTPRLHVAAPLDEETQLDLVYSVDVWTSASVDIRTSASRLPSRSQNETDLNNLQVRPVTEQRDEVDVALDHRIGDFDFGGSYRYSTENDYESHGGSLGVSVDLANKAARLAFTTRAYFDRVGRAGDPQFDRPANNLSARLAFTQVLDPDTFIDLTYEITRQAGYLSSPYRYVRFASSVDQLPRTCITPVWGCLPENNPNSRLRHAVAVSGRRAFGDAFSMGVGYRFYLDDWGIMSHTANIDVALTIAESWLLSLGYRFYQQGKADHYQSYYLSMPLAAHYASDKKLSTLMTHHIDAELSRTWELDELGSQLRAILLASPAYFQYIDFPLLDHVQALEVTLAMQVRL